MYSFDQLLLLSNNEIEKLFKHKRIRVYTKSEKENLKIARKSLVARCAIKKGEIFDETNLTTKRPATGISAMRYDEFLGKAANKNYAKDELIKE